MKKILTVIIPLILILASCAKAPTTQVKLPPSFTSEAEITVGDTAYSAAFNRFADGCWQVEMLSPAAVKGLIFTISGGETDVGFDGLHFTFDTNRFPAGSVISSATGAFDRLCSQEIDAINGEENSLATGTLGDDSYTLTMTKNHIPQRLELESGMTIEFVKFDIIEQVEG